MGKDQTERGGEEGMIRPFIKGYLLRPHTGQK